MELARNRSSGEVMSFVTLVQVTDLGHSPSAMPNGEGWGGSLIGKFRFCVVYICGFLVHNRFGDR